jgi:uncharacterized protein YndB with AHSA1/START domain
MRTQTIENSAPGQQLLDVVRDFNASPAQLFLTMTEPFLVARWLRPRHQEIQIVEYDVRPGGRYHYVRHGADTLEVAFCGVFHTVEPYSLIVQTLECLAAPGDVCLEVFRFTGHEGVGRISMRTVFPSPATLEAAIAAGVEDEIREIFDRVAELAEA